MPENRVADGDILLNMGPSPHSERDPMFIRTALAAAFLLFHSVGCTMQDSSSSSMSDEVRTPAYIREHGNHLADQASLYLRQHAHNPLDWYPWGEEALARARREDKPIFLSIGYSSCHWCHVMEAEVFEHDDVAQYMNDHFICIKVDREERPDLDTVYMSAVQAMTGRGGWPMSVFLTPDLKPFYGGTYFPRAQFLDLTRKIVDVYSNQRDNIEQQAAQLAEHIESQPATLLGGDSNLTQELITVAVDNARDIYDPHHAGFSQGQKFPTPIKWRFLLHQWRRHPDPELRDMLTATLEAMQGGGIHDLIGGGFHRYTVDVEWTVPHFEKMLYDNGQLAGLFLEAGVAFARPDFSATGADVLDFLLRDMRGDTGAFYASFDADSGGEEGTYYIWSRDEILAEAGPEDGPALAAILGVGQKGNFEHSGKSVLTYRADAQKIQDQYGLDPVAATALFTKHRRQLRQVRDQRTQPGLDTKVVTAWNALVISSLAEGYAVTGRQKYLDGAVKATDTLLAKHLRQDGSLWRTSDHGRPSGEGILDDYALLASALLDVYQVSDDPEIQARYLGKARELLDFARSEFHRAEGGYFMSRDQVTSPLGRPVDTFDNVTPSGQAAMYQALIALAAITGETGYLDEARDDLARWTGLIRRAGIETAWMCDAVSKIIEPYYDVVIAGDQTDEAATSLRAAVLTRLPVNAVLTTVPAKGPSDKLQKLAPALEGKKAVAGQATAYVCEFGTCQAPTQDAAVMLKQLEIQSNKKTE